MVSATAPLITRTSEVSKYFSTRFASRLEVAGVFSEGLRMIALPAARADAYIEVSDNMRLAANNDVL